MDDCPQRPEWVGLKDSKGFTATPGDDPVTDATRVLAFQDKGWTLFEDIYMAQCSSIQ